MGYSIRNAGSNFEGMKFVKIFNWCAAVFGSMFLLGFCFIMIGEM